MTTLADFNDEMRAQIVSLPYRVGVFISHADDEHGEVDDEREMAALEACIKGIAKLQDNRPLSADIMRESLARKDQWSVWAQGCFQVPNIARDVMGALAGVASEDEVKDFRRALLDVANTVAQAYGEFGDGDADEGGGLFGGIVNKITAKIAAVQAGGDAQPMNISAAEDAAIQELKAALEV